MINATGRYFGNRIDGGQVCSRGGRGGEEIKQATSAVQAQSWLFCFFCSAAFLFYLNRSFYLNKSMENCNWKKLNSKKTKLQRVI